MVSTSPCCHCPPQRRLIVQVVRVFYMSKLDYSNPKPPLTRIPLKQTPVRAAFWGASDRLGICTAGLGEVVNLSTVSKVVHGGAMPSPHQVVSGIHDGLPIIRTCSAPTSPGGTPLLGTLTKTKEARVTTGDGCIIATVQPNGIENYQVSTRQNCAQASVQCAPSREASECLQDGDQMGCWCSFVLK